jgi:hypothetical protein
MYALVFDSGAAAQKCAAGIGTTETWNNSRARKGPPNRSLMLLRTKGENEMAVCDLCNAPGMGTLISAENMRQAVYKKGFNPFALGLNANPMNLMFGADAAYENWKNMIVAQDTSDWNICPGCMEKLKPYLVGAPKPTGVREASVSFDPLVSTRAGAVAEQKYKKTKKWWEFWK